MPHCPLCGPHPNISLECVFSFYICVILKLHGSWANCKCLSQSWEIQTLTSPPPPGFFLIHLHREGKNTYVPSCSCKWGRLLGDSGLDKWEEKIYFLSLTEMRQGVKRPQLPFLPSCLALLMFETVASILRWRNKPKAKRPTIKDGRVERTN